MKTKNKKEPAKKGFFIMLKPSTKRKAHSKAIEDGKDLSEVTETLLSMYITESVIIKS